MKDYLTFIKDCGKTLAEAVGWVTLGLFSLTLIPSLNFIPKGFMLYIMMPFIFGK